MLIELWRQSLDYQGIFRTRMFPAQVARYPGGAGAEGAIHVYGCPGSDFIGKEVMVGTPNMRRSVSGIVVTSNLHRCGEKDQKLAHQFAGQEAQLGLGEEA